MSKLKTSLLFFYTETSLHAGSGAGVGAIDLPLQRERMSELPQVQGSGIKGALRELFRADESGRELEEVLFGPRPPDSANETKDPQDANGEDAKRSKAHEHAGALAVTDARLLLMPVRTAHGGWAWITSPMILQRLARDLGSVDGNSRGKPPPWASLTVDSDSALVARDDVPIASKKKLVIEDALYVAKPNGVLVALADFIASGLPCSAVYKPVRERLVDQLAVISDEEMCYWARHGTEVVTRVRIDPKTGTVAKGALWTEEALPSESLLWSMVMISDSRKQDRKDQASQLHDEFFTGIRDRERIFLGGDRTVGRGLVALGQIGGK
jgi:CRISPR-associated protein Cmr4